MEISATEDIVPMDMSDGPENSLHGVFLEGQVVINYVDAHTGNYETATLSLTPEQLTNFGLPLNEISIRAEDGEFDTGSIVLNHENPGAGGTVISLSEETPMSTINQCNFDRDVVTEEATETGHRKCDTEKSTGLDILNVEETKQNVCEGACGEEISSGGLKPESNDGDLEKHTKIHEDDKEIFRWDVCGRKCPTKSSLLRHIQSHKSRTEDGAQDADGDSSRNLDESMDVSKHIENLINKCPMACAWCGKRFVSKINLKIHRRQHKGEKPFHCVYCDECYISKSELVEHLGKHNDENQHKCHICERNFNSRETLHEHEESHDTFKKGFSKISENLVTTPEELAQPSTIYTDSESPKKHLIEPAESSRIETKPGDKKEQIERAESNRITTECVVQTETGKPLGDNIVNCKICKKELIDNITAINHAKTHSDEKPFRCGLCGKCFPRRSNLFRHIKTHSARDAVYKRDVGGASSTTKDTLKDYAPMHTGENQYKCKYCDKYLANRTSLASHERRHFAVKSHRCDFCGKGFTESFFLQQHRRIHTGEKPYKCQICNKAFVDGSRLSRHKKIHEKIRNKTFICEYCGRSFNRANALGLHKQHHHDVVTPYQCEVCGKHYACSTTLKTHRRIHSGEKPYKCQYCDNSFRSAGLLTVHTKIHTREKNNQI